MGQVDLNKDLAGYKRDEVEDAIDKENINFLGGYQW